MKLKTFLICCILALTSLAIPQEGWSQREGNGQFIQCINVESTSDPREDCITLCQERLKGSYNGIYTSSPPFRCQSTEIPCYCLLP